MKDELLARLTKYLDALESGATKGGEFLSEQAPEVCREIVNWKIAAGALSLGYSLLACMAVLILARMAWVFNGPKPVFQPPEKDENRPSVYAREDLERAKTKFDNEYTGWQINRFATVGITLVACGIFLGCSKLSVETAAKAIFSPRLIILEEIRSNLR